MKLSVIMPTYNEAATLVEIIEKVRQVPIEKELIIVDDGSTDATAHILKDYEDKENIIVMRHEKNKGKGSAIRTARQRISGEMVIMQDADLETDPNDYLHLIKPICEGKAKVVYGSRLLAPNVDYDWRYYWGGRLITFIANLLYHQNITDVPACYKVFDVALFQSIPLRCKRFEFCPEITAKVSKRGIKILELPMRYYPRTKKEGKKLKFKDGFIALWTLIKYKFIAD